MAQITIRFRTPKFVKEIPQFFKFLRNYIRGRGYKLFSRFEVGKNFIVDILYKKRGRYARPFLHFGTISLLFMVITFGPVLFAKEDRVDQEARGGVLAAASDFTVDFYTLQAEEVKQYRGGEAITHIVQEGETIEQIATRYGLESSTVLWENDLTLSSKIKPGDELVILPVDGVRHKVKRGETIYSIGKKYDLDDTQVQVIVDYPFNEFLNDETFELATGQYLVIPGGVKPNTPVAAVRKQTYVSYTPDAGVVSGSGNFVWPASGGITQGYSFYHKAFDIANRSGGPILAADSGTVMIAGWVDNSGYGNRVVIDHGNGYVTLYAHMSVTQVRPGQRVNRGDVVGQMGSTGRSTGTHLHFEIRSGSGLLNPGNFLK
ncbi:MAG: peptidoglycan DD-metalloendopeptidase family protein [Candidatus Pacebacteria bacterium]|nr:peptidoglycan DD-metalloendopeptidase family protein [Candidatus Paceibacterota bacterium]